MRLAFICIIKSIKSDMLSEGEVDVGVFCFWSFKINYAVVVMAHDGGDDVDEHWTRAFSHYSYWMNF